MLSKVSFLVLITVFLLGNPVLAKEETFPFVAAVVKDNVNLRAGPNTNFEKLAQLKINQEVVVLAKEYGWYKIKLPTEANSFIIAKYVQRLGDSGIMTADRVNIRAQANVNATSLGQLKIGEKIQIKEQLNDWFKIVPIADSFGWVSEEFLTFKAKYSPPQMPALPPAVVSAPEVKKKAVKSTVPAPSSIIKITGILQKEERLENQDVFYKVTDESKKIYYLFGFKDMMNNLVNRRVKVDGVLKKQASFGPVIEILKIQPLF